MLTKALLIKNYSRQSLRLFLFSFVLMNGFGFSVIDHSSLDQHVLAISIMNVKNENGQIHIALYNSKENFLKKFWRGETVKASKGEVKVTFTDLPPGDYAIGIIHDENENKKLDTNWIGLPNEGYGFSNDASGLFGPPDFEHAKFHFTLSTELMVSMKYF